MGGAGKKKSGSRSKVKINKIKTKRIGNRSNILEHVLISSVRASFACSVNGRFCLQMYVARHEPCSTELARSLSQLILVQTLIRSASLALWVAKLCLLFHVVSRRAVDATFFFSVRISNTGLAYCHVTSSWYPFGLICGLAKATRFAMWLWILTTVFSRSADFVGPICVKMSQLHFGADFIPTHICCDLNDMKEENENAYGGHLLIETIGL